MGLSANQRERYARHLLLAEIGDAQQEAWCSARVVFAPGADPNVRRHAEDYLRRAGVPEVTQSGESSVATSPLAGTADVQRVAGRPDLEPAAAALLGAFAAVEALKQHAGVGTPAAFPPALTLSEEEP